MKKLHEYEPLHLLQFEPEQRYERRHWIDDLQLSETVAVMKRHYGGTLGNINVIWKVTPVNVSHETNMARAILYVTEELPQYHTRKMRKDFLSTYQKQAKTSNAHLNEIYRELTADATAASSMQEQQQRNRIAEFLASNDEEGIITDLRRLNRKKVTNFGEFWDEVDKLFSEYGASVHERRHGTFLYLPFAISVRELVERIEKRRSEIAVPSEEWVRLQFSPTNSRHRSALSYTGRFNIKFQVQRRQMRPHHDDSKYVYHQQQYLKEFAIRFKENCSFHI